MFQDFIEQENFEENRLLLSPNPMMCIALSGELLGKISETRSRFENICRGLKADLLELGKQYNLKITNEKYFRTLIMDTDFQNRTVLKIITQCQLGALMSEEDPKAENIMKQVYIGEEATKCDGSLLGFSNLFHILTSKPKKADDSTRFLEIVKIDFKYNYDVDYTFQHRYRSKSIYIFFLKELFFAIFDSIIMVYIFLDYLIMFRDKDIYFVQTYDLDKKGIPKL